jgi:hypothetical protein
LPGKYAASARTPQWRNALFEEAGKLKNEKLE